MKLTDSLPRAELIERLVLQDLSQYYSASGYNGMVTCYGRMTKKCMNYELLNDCETWRPARNWKDVLEAYSEVFEDKKDILVIRKWRNTVWQM